MLTNHPPYGPLQFRGIGISWSNVLTHADMVAFAAGLAKHTSLQSLELFFFPLDTSEAMALIVDAVISLRLRRLSLLKCRCTPAIWLPALTRLINAGWLKDLDIAYSDTGQLLLDDEPTRLFCEAVLASGLTKDYFLMYVSGSDLAAVRDAVLFVNCRQAIKYWIRVVMRCRVHLSPYPNEIGDVASHTRVRIISKSVASSVSTSKLMKPPPPNLSV